MEKKLCIIENGDAVGVCGAVGFAPDMLLTSAAHPSHARNKGLVALRELDAHFCSMDDDDYYGPAYMQEHVDNAEKNRITGKVTHWVRFEGQKKLWLFNRMRTNRPTAWVQAATLGGFARDVPNYHPILGEEIDLCARFRAQGGVVQNLSVGHFLYQRRSDSLSHAYKVGPRGFADQHGPWFEEHMDSLLLVNKKDPPLGVRKAYNQVA